MSSSCSFFLPILQACFLRALTAPASCLISHSPSKSSFIKYSKIGSQLSRFPLSCRGRDEALLHYQCWFLVSPPFAKEPLEAKLQDHHCVFSPSVSDCGAWGRGMQMHQLVFLWYFGGQHHCWIWSSKTAWKMVTTLPGDYSCPCKDVRLYSWKFLGDEVHLLAHASNNSRVENLRKTKDITANGQGYSYSCPLPGKTCPTWWDETQQPFKAHSKTRGPLHMELKHVVKAQWPHANKCQAYAEGLYLNRTMVFPWFLSPDMF